MEIEDFYQLNENKNMDNGIGKINWVNVKSGIVYAILLMLAMFLLSIVQSVIDHKSIFGIDWKLVIDHGALEALPTLLFVLVLFKNALTTNSGNFAGVVKVVDPGK